MSKFSAKAIVTGIMAVSIVMFATPAYAATGPIQFFSPFWWLGLGGSTEAQTKVTTPASPTPSPKASPEALLPAIGNKIMENSVAEAKEPEKVVAGWLTPWGDDSFVSFKNNLDTITEVHPFVYTIGADGVTVVPDKNDWHKAEVMQLAKEHGIKVIPTISGDVDYSDLMLNDPAKRTAHINALMKAIQDNGYDGIDIDYEGFKNGYNRDVYTAFMQELSTRVHQEGKLLTIAIEAFNTKQNWEALGNAVDRFMIMGYDYHSARGPEVGAIGPASWLDGVVDYAATRVDKSKIVLGLGSYGYSWIWNGTKYTSTAVSHADALQIAAETGNTIKRDAENTPYFTYNRGGGQRYLYFEDAMSTAPKLDLVGKHDIAGIAFWRLGTEDPAVWQTVADKM